MKIGNLWLAVTLILSACAVPPASSPAPALPAPEPVLRTVAPPIEVPRPPIPEPAPVVVVTNPLSEDEQQALSLLGFLGQVTSASMDDQKREFHNANQQFQKAKTDPNRVRLAALLMLPNTGFQDDAKALSMLEGISAKNPNPIRELAVFLHGQITERQRQVREEQKRAEAIQQKLDNLKAIERSLLDRERKSRPAGSVGAK